MLTLHMVFDEQQRRDFTFSLQFLEKDFCIVKETLIERWLTDF